MSPGTTELPYQQKRTIPPSLSKTAKKSEPRKLLGKPFKRNFLDLCHQRRLLSGSIDLRLHGGDSDEF